MKHILVAVLAVLLLCSSAVAESITISDHTPLAVGANFPAGTYTVTAAEGSANTGFAVLDENSNILNTYAVDAFTKSVMLTLTEGQQLMVLMDAMVFSPMSDLDIAAANAADPYLHAISGVDLHQAFSKAESIAESSGDYPLLYSVGFAYNDDLQSITVTVFLNDEATATDAKAYAYDIIRLLNTCCIYQNTAIQPSAPKYLGGIYDALNCSVTAIKFSDMPDMSKAFLTHLIPAGTHGFGTIDGKELNP